MFPKKAKVILKTGIPAEQRSTSRPIEAGTRGEVIGVRKNDRLVKFKGHTWPHAVSLDNLTKAF